MSIHSGRRILPASSTLVQMNHYKSLGFIKKGLFPWFLKVGFMGLALFATVTFEDKVEAPSSDDIFCISDCATCPVICSPPLPQSPSVPHSPPSPFYFTFSPSPPKSQSPPPPPPPTPSSRSAPPPPSKSYNTPPSGSAQPQPTVISGPHDYYYPYYYFYASSASSLYIHAPFLVLLLFLIGYSFVGNM